jgi:hypothetical protein
VRPRRTATAVPRRTAVCATAPPAEMIAGVRRDRSCVAVRSSLCPPTRPSSSTPSSQGKLETDQLIKETGNTSKHPATEPPRPGIDITWDVWSLSPSSTQGEGPLGLGGGWGAGRSPWWPSPQIRPCLPGR